MLASGLEEDNFEIRDTLNYKQQDGNPFQLGQFRDPINTLSSNGQIESGSGGMEFSGKSG